ncbi:ferritin family protein [Methanosarcina barkeri]|uniref:ferritin family protein n=1 Tax=Methanosarcina barkeri TaxID=2208 RepID=UPI0024370D06|nr:ferritin family protein [Methanosarcina barkeri]
MRYVHFANQAEIEKLSNVARLFRAIAHAEYVHAGDHYKELKHLEGDLSQIVWQFLDRVIPGKTLSWPLLVRHMR